jgi:peroxiredoxin
MRKWTSLFVLSRLSVSLFKEEDTMPPTILSKQFAAFLLGSLVFLTGCGGSESSDVDDRASIENAPKNKLPTTSIDGAGNSSQQKPPGPEKGTPEWLILQIKKVRLQPFPKTNNVGELAKVQRKRNARTIELATQAIAATHDKPAHQELFDEAVHHLVEARVQLALQGDTEARNSLYDDAEALYKRNPKSRAASEAAFALTRFIHASARRYARQDPAWLDEFSKQARIYATNFPNDTERAANLLSSAAKTCELHRQPTGALTCYTMLVEKFPKTKEAEEAQAVLRRLLLKGKTLQLAGPTLDGGFVRIDDLRGKLVLIVFWSAGVKRFNDDLPELIAVTTRHEKAGLTVIGINLDEEEPTLDAFLERTELTWTQIFHPESKKRGWASDIVRYYGVRQLPTYWLVDRQGTVVETDIDVKQLDRIIQPYLAKNSPKSPKRPTSKTSSP